MAPVPSPKSSRASGSTSDARSALDTFRRCIYSRWFYASLAFVCVLDVAADTLDILHPGENLAIDVISLVLSGVAAVLALAVFVDLGVRRARP